MAELIYLVIRRITRNNADNEIAVKIKILKFSAFLFACFIIMNTKGSKCG